MRKIQGFLPVTALIIIIFIIITETATNETTWDFRKRLYNTCQFMFYRYDGLLLQRKTSPIDKTKILVIAYTVFERRLINLLINLSLIFSD